MTEIDQEAIQGTVEIIADLLNKGASIQEVTNHLLRISGELESEQNSCDDVNEDCEECCEAPDEEFSNEQMEELFEQFEQFPEDVNDYLDQEESNPSYNQTKHIIYTLGRVVLNGLYTEGKITQKRAAAIRDILTTRAMLEVNAKSVAE